MTDWFDVDKQGLARLVTQKGKAFVLYELVQNAFDAPGVTNVTVTLEKDPSARSATVTVEDDCPQGFTDIAHAFTLFADSEKKTDPTKRGRFNLGEKLVLALCTEAEIRTTTGTVSFDRTGRRELRRKESTGSVFIGRLPMTNAEVSECIDAMHRLIVPRGITTTLVVIVPGNRYQTVLHPRSPIAQVEASLQTEIADAEGVLRPSTRKTTISIYPPKGEAGMLYEMGIPVVETGDAFDVDIAQKVPLNFNRDNVPAAFLRAVRTHVLNAVHDRIDQERANEPWVRDALGDSRITSDAVRSVVKQRFGEKAVAYDPSDREANKRAVAAGYTVVHGAQLSRAEWENVRTADALPAAGRVTPSSKPYSDDPNAPPVKVIPGSEWTQAQTGVVLAIEALGERLLGFRPKVRIVCTTNNFSAAYGERTLDLNLQKLGAKWFSECLARGELSERVIDVLIHEFGHEYCDDHLSEDYYNALTRLGAKLVLAVANNGKCILKVGT